MGVEEGDGRRCLVGALQLLNPELEARYVLPHELRPRLALAIVVLAPLRLLGTDTLLTGGLHAVAFLHWRGSETGQRRSRRRHGRQLTILRFLQRKHALPVACRRRGHILRRRSCACAGRRTSLESCT